MKNDGAKSYGQETVAAVRMDYFLSFPHQQAIAKEELRKYSVLKEQLQQLDRIVEEYLENSQNLEEFCGLLFYDLLESENYSGNKSYTKIARIYYPYKKGGVPMEADLTSQGEEFAYGKQYPLYQAFLTYISLDREKLQKGDNIIARNLELQWDDKAISKLHKNVSALNEGKEIIGFYTGLVQQIQEFKNKFEYEDWLLPEEKGLNASDSVGNRGTAATTMPPQLTQFWVYDGNETMPVYLVNSKNLAWSTAGNIWVPLTPNMLVAINDKWEPIKLNPQGNIIV